jgi:hypothetical protein
MAARYVEGLLTYVWIAFKGLFVGFELYTESHTFQAVDSQLFKKK